MFQFGFQIVWDSNPSGFGILKCPSLVTTNLKVNNFEVMQNLNLAFNKVVFILAFARSFSDRTIFSSQCMLPAAKKDVQRANQRSMVIYEYVCHCDSQYKGHTTQTLQKHIKQHVPKAIRQRTTATQEQGTHRSQPARTQRNRKCKAKSI